MIEVLRTKNIITFLVAHKEFKDIKIPGNKTVFGFCQHGLYSRINKNYLFSIKF